MSEVDCSPQKTYAITHLLIFKTPTCLFIIVTVVGYSYPTEILAKGVYHRTCFKFLKMLWPGFLDILHCQPLKYSIRKRCPLAVFKLIQKQGSMWIPVRNEILCEVLVSLKQISKKCLATIDIFRDIWSAFSETSVIKSILLATFPSDLHLSLHLVRNL